MPAKKVILLIFIFLSLNSIAKCQSVEYTVKASLIEKFARFSDWPPNAIDEYFVIGVLGKSPFRSELEDLAKKVKIKDKPVKINYFDRVQEAQACQLLFICASEKSNIAEIVKYVGKNSVLLVGDTPGFSEKGVHFNFYFKADETLHFEIYPKAFERANLKTDMQMLSIGKIIN